MVWAWSGGPGIVSVAICSRCCREQDTQLPCPGSGRLSTPASMSPEGLSSAAFFPVSFCSRICQALPRCRPPGRPLRARPAQPWVWSPLQADLSQPGSGGGSGDSSGASLKWQPHSRAEHSVPRGVAALVSSPGPPEGTHDPLGWARAFLAPAFPGVPQSHVGVEGLPSPGAASSTGGGCHSGALGEPRAPGWTSCWGAGRSQCWCKYHRLFAVPGEFQSTFLSKYFFICFLLLGQFPKN